MDPDLKRIIKTLPNGFTKAAKCRECGTYFAYDVREQKTCPHCHITDGHFRPWSKKKDA